MKNNHFYLKKDIKIYYKESTVCVEKEISKEDINTIGSVHGGIIAMLIDTAGCFVFKEKMKDHSIITTNLNISFLKRVTLLGKKITAVGEILKTGVNIGISEIDLYCGNVVCAKGIVQVYFKKNKKIKASIKDLHQ